MKNIINPNLNIKELNNRFKENGYVVVNDYLKTDVAEKLYQFFAYDMPYEWWCVATFPSIDSDRATYHRNKEENEESIIQARLFAEKAFSKNHFSYAFHRTLNDHYDQCDCMECQSRKFLNSNESFDFISSVTNLNVTGTNELFAACYVPGDFLSPHQDSSNGIVGFVYQLTKEWRPEYGGLLHFLNDDGTIIENIEIPTFNTLTLFLLPKDKGKLHYVSHVNPSTPEIRLSLTGWYTD